jgi:TRAP-type C4-dicarboxylate transport system permease small subunit
MANAQHPSGPTSAGLQVILAWVFGLALCLLSGLVVAEVLMRKILLISLQGVDELSGYVLAATSSLAFFLALADRAHMRIDILYAMMPLLLRRISDGLAVLAIAAGACLLVAMGWITFAESREFNSVSQTPWATPMVIPQSIWLAALVPFMGLSLLSLLRWTGAAIRRDRSVLAEFRAKGSEDELEEQLRALDERSELTNTREERP